MPERNECRLAYERGGDAVKRSFTTMLIAAVMLCAGQSAVAQEACKLTVRNASGSSIGRIDSGGKIRRSTGSIVGRFEKGIVRDSSGSTIGRIDPNGTIRNRSGSAIGRVDSSGKLRNSSGSTVGRIDADGKVRNRSGAMRGRFDGYVPSCRHVAAAYLFFFEPLYNR